MKRSNWVGVVALAIAELGWGALLALGVAWPVWWAHVAVLAAVAVWQLPMALRSDKRGWVHLSTVVAAAGMFTWGFGGLALLGSRPVLAVVGLLTWVFVAGGLVLFVAAAYRSRSVSLPETCDATVVLGAGLFRDRPSPLLALRCDQAVRLCPPGVPLIVSGGQGPDEPCTEADAMRRYLSGSGHTVLCEEAATNTRENILYSLDLLGLHKPHIGIVTSDFHVLRTRGLARELQQERPFSFTVAGSATPASARPAAFLREFVAYVLWLL